MSVNNVIIKSSNYINDLLLFGDEKLKSKNKAVDATLFSAVLLSSTNIVFAQGSGSGGMGSIVGKFVKQVAALRKQLVILGTSIAAISLVICAIIFIASKNERKMEAAKDWAKRIAVGYVCLLLVVVFVSFLQEWGKGLDNSVDSGGDSWK